MQRLICSSSGLILQVLPERELTEMNHFCRSRYASTLFAKLPFDPMDLSQEGKYDFALPRNRNYRIKRTFLDDLHRWRRNTPEHALNR